MVSQAFLNFTITWGILITLGIIFYSQFKKQTVAETLKSIKEFFTEMREDE